MKIEVRDEHGEYLPVSRICMRVRAAESDRRVQHLILSEGCYRYLRLMASSTDLNLGQQTLAGLPFSVVFGFDNDMVGT